MAEAPGPSVLPEAYAAWEASQPTKEPFVATPSDRGCGFCDYKAWCSHWWLWRHSGRAPPQTSFVDVVVLIERIDSEKGVGLLEICSPNNEDGGIQPTGRKIGAVFEGNALNHLHKILEEDWKGAVFIGSAKADGQVWKVGDWCDVLPWKPIPDRP